MNFQLSEELKALQSTVRRFVQNELYPLGHQSYPEGEDLPREILAPLQEKAKAMGLWLLDVPEEYGGAGLGLLAQCVIEEELFKAPFLPFRSGGGQSVCGPDVRPILFECNEKQKERYLYPVLRGEKRVCFAQTEPDAGTDPASMKTLAVRDKDCYIINGVKRFITGAEKADFAQLLAATDPKPGPKRITCFLVDLNTPGITVTKRQPTMMGDAPCEVVFENVAVPAENVVGGEGKGFELAQKWLTVGRVKNHAARCIGMAQRALEMAMDYAQIRVTFGRPLAERQAIQFMIADSAMEIHAARLMMYHCAEKWDQGQKCRDESYMVKIFATEMAGRVVDRSIQIHGGMGLTKELPLEKWYRQVRSVRITEGAVEVLRWRLARNLIRTNGGLR